MTKMMMITQTQMHTHRITAKKCNNMYILSCVMGNSRLGLFLYLVNT